MGESTSSAQVDLTREVLKEPGDRDSPADRERNTGNIGWPRLGNGKRLHARYFPTVTTAAPRTTSLRRMAMLGNHLPRQCGIATFTTDLSQAISSEFPALESFVLAMNDVDQGYAYPARVRFEIAAADVPSYRRAADFLGISSVELVSVQHEYGIFGGKAGSHVLEMLRDLRMPIVTTLHTVLAEPDPRQRLAMEELTRVSERLVVMSTHGASLLRDIYGVPAAKIDVIPHGIPRLPSARRGKLRLGVDGKLVILTFGLLSPDKGIEHVIDSLPAILERHPNTIYIVLGATHPQVKERHGETYRLMLEHRAQRLGVDSAVVFHNRFVGQDELTEFLAAADVYITPYLNPEQSTSGTLAYALGSGKAVVSTPYAYARELLAGGRGILVPWPTDEPRAMAGAIIDLLGDDQQCAALRERAAGYGRSMLWPVVARAYVQSFERAQVEHADRRRSDARAKRLAEQPLDLPEVSLEHLGRLSDSAGILQHAAFTVPRHEDGYCLDDNARALLLTTLLEEAGIGEVKTVHSLGNRYLAFVRHSFNANTRRFRNFMSYSRQWLEDSGSEDSQGRALWALGTVIGHGDDSGRRSLAHSLFHQALPVVQEFTSPRAWAYVLLGIDEYLRAFLGERRVQEVRQQLADQLFKLYRRTSSPEWPWFEEWATYCNARLSQALFVSGVRMGHERMKAAALQSLDWLSAVQRPPSGAGYFEPVGSNGFYERGGAKASFDQQPVEVCAMVSACLAAWRVTGDARWASEARNAFDWFLGQNQLQRSLYDAATGGCRDGLHADRVNENQGAESTLSFLMALTEIRAAPQRIQPERPGTPLSNQGGTV